MLMKAVRISEDAHVKVMDNRTNELVSAGSVVENAIDIVYNEQSQKPQTDVDYSNCPECEKLHDAMDTQTETVEELRRKNTTIIKANGDAAEEYEKLRHEKQGLEHDLKIANDQVNEFRKQNGEKYDADALQACKDNQG